MKSYHQGGNKCVRLNSMPYPEEPEGLIYIKQTSPYDPETTIQYELKVSYNELEISAEME